MWDVAIVGSGPAGATCAAFCAAAGLRTVVLEREIFPREKVCGDCLNPACWPVLRRLGVFEQVRALPGGRLERVEFIGIQGTVVAVELPRGEGVEIAVKRSLFDALLMARAKESGAEVLEGFSLQALCRSNNGWRLETGNREVEARFLVAADGRNSTVARLCNLLPSASRERVALQAHVPLPKDFGNRVVLQLLPGGYSGQAPIGANELNLCLVGSGSSLPLFRKWAEATFSLTNVSWRTITPLMRASVQPAHNRLLLVGDAAEVVEPFTGEGIYYALRTAELAAAAIVAADETRYRIEHAKLYRGRLWINRIARAAVLSPRVTSSILPLLRNRPELLRWLTGRVVA